MYTRRRASWIGLTGLIWVAGTGASCSRASDEGGAKRTPEPPPPAHVELPADLRIPLEIDGEAAPPIDAAQLRALAPDFADDDHRAWKLTRLLGEPFARPGAVVEAEGESGVAITMRPPAGPAEPQPVLTLTRRGELAAALVKADDPFPDYHGRGGRLRRPGDPLPRIFPVTRLSIYVAEGRPQDGGQGGSLNEQGWSRHELSRLTILVGGKPAPDWPATLAQLETSWAIADGERRPGWSLREIAARVAPEKRVVALLAEGNQRREITAAEWQDETRTPIVRANRRGSQIKFQWVDGAQGVADKDSELRGVTTIELGP
jgi:hypothetical protein